MVCFTVAIFPIRILPLVLKYDFLVANYNEDKVD